MNSIINHLNHEQSDAYHHLNRADRGTGHNRIIDHMYNKIIIGHLEMYPVTTEHFLQKVPRHSS